ncbi:MAG: glutamine-hydrolyzing carbamoyl-phosphate synthase small subunit [Atopobiaceae bacterium]|nr:glutamine-hydrolyzing carbamoyl-phosphate synthase small subunit [Atopobiaceae bacterium]
MNPLVAHGTQSPALLVLEDGTCFRGRACGALGEAFGEIVFNTSMTGYQEITTDPSYAGQIVTFTYPQLGNYGVSKNAMQSAGTALAGIVVRDMCYTPSHRQSEGSLPDFLRERGVVAIEGVDTRALTLRIRSAGAMRAAISTTDLDPQSLVARVDASPAISAHNHVADVSPRRVRVVAASNEAERTSSPAPGRTVAGAATGEAGQVASVLPEFSRTDGDDDSSEVQRFASLRSPLRVVAYDCGEKRGIENGLAQVGCEVVAVPFDTPAAHVLSLEPDGVFFSNGPGDPTQVTATARAAQDLLGRIPVFGICLGNQLIAMAAGARIEKLPFGHHGGNEPVMNLLTRRVEITAQNHNYGLVFESMGPLVPELSGGETRHANDLRQWVERGIAPVVKTPHRGRVRLTHVNLNDGTPEGIQFLDVPAFSVQYHPESSPGPHDARYVFEAFAQLMDAWRKRKVAEKTVLGTVDGPAPRLATAAEWSHESSS